MKNSSSATATSSSSKKEGKTSTTTTKKLTIKQKLEIQAAKWKAKTPSKKRLPSSFFDQHTVEASKQLLGKLMSINGKECYITETEAYRGREDDDGAAHAYSRDPSLVSSKTKKKQQTSDGTDAPPFIAYQAPGQIYVYSIYGMHFCMNIIVEPEGKPGCVLIRAVRDRKDGTLIDGPGRVCKYFNEMTKESHNGVPLNQKQGHEGEEDKKSCWIGEGVKVEKFKTTKRIGITKAVDFPWRFVVDEDDE
jgi:DNA-3-methyladenine glycosylase